MAKKTKTKKVPIRMCVGCRERFNKKDLVRIVRTPKGEVKLDRTGKLSGRGAYICPGKSECLDRAIKAKTLERNLEIEISQETYDKLREELSYNE
jgi:predicted RNA-binding protein YlxR (DUF448 family)